MIKSEHNNSLKSFNTSMKKSKMVEDQDFKNPYYKNTKLPALQRPPLSKG